MDEPSSSGTNSIECQTLLKDQTAFCGELMRMLSSSNQLTDAWRNNTCVISRRKMHMYENPKSSKPLEVLDLRNAKVSETYASNPSSKNCHFHVTSRVGESHHFAANTEGDKRAWMKALTLEIKKKEISDDESDYENPDYTASENFITSSKVKQKRSTSSNYCSGADQDQNCHGKLKSTSIQFPCNKKSKYERAIWMGESDKAQKILLYLNINGAYIIRKSSICDPYLKTLMVFHNGVILKFCISESIQGKCLMSGKEFHNGDDLINYYSINHLPCYSIKLNHSYYDIHDHNVLKK